MHLFYNGTPLHELGRVVIGGQSFDLSPDGDGPQRARTSLRVSLHFFEQTYRDNANLVGTVRDLVKVQHGTLLWQDPVTGAEYLNQTVTLSAVDLPEDPNAWGTYHQRLDLVFTWFEHDWTGNGLTATFTKTGGSPIVLGNVFLWRQTYNADRFNPLRKHRSRAAGRIVASGQFLGDPKASLSTRQTNLLAEKEAMMEAVNGADGALSFGDFTGTVRVTEFDAQINQPSAAIDWSLSAEYTAFPDETGYAMAEFEIRVREDTESGEVRLNHSGRIGAESAAAAAAKLALLRQSVRDAQEALGNELLLLSTEKNESHVHADTDGEAFLELAFADEYRVVKAGEVTRWTLTVSDAEDVRGGFIRRTYSGTVESRSQSSWDAAYQAAVTKARILGANKHQMLITGSIAAEDRQMSSDVILSTPDRHASVRFDFEYQLRGSRVYLEVNAEVTRETFGPNTETVSGFCVASTLAAARTQYNTVKAGYASYLIRNERTSESRQKIGQTGGVPVGGTRTPPNAGVWGTTVNSTETASGGLVQQEARLEFSFTVHRDKSNEIAIRFDVQVNTNFQARTRTRRLSGTAWGATLAEANFAIGQVTSAYGTGTLIESDRREAREKFYGQQAGSGDDRPAAALDSGGAGSALVQVDFTDVYQDAITGDEGILQSELSEDIEHSGPRLVVLPTATQRDVVQQCGWQSGRRTVSGSVTAATETIALAWARRQYHLPWSGLGDEPSERLRRPPRLSLSPVWLPLADGVARSGNGDYNPESGPVNTQLWRVNFSFEEILLDHDYIAE